MTWNPDAPIEMLDRASRVVWELCGPAPYLNWLEQEVSRTKIYLNYKTAVVFFASTAGGARDPQQPVPPTAATGAATITQAMVTEMADVLRWYGSRRNYDMVGEIIVDEGQRARGVLAKHGFEPPYEAS